MSKMMMVASALALAAMVGVSGAQAGGHSSSSGLLGVNLNVGNLVGAKVNVADSNGHGNDSLLGVNLKVDDLVNAKVDVGSGGRGGSLVGANVNVGGNGHNNDLVGANVNIGNAFSGYGGGVGGHDGG